MRSACERYIDWSTDYLAGELDVAARSEFTGHVESCPSCSEELTRMRALFGMLRDELSSDASSFALTTDRVDALYQAVETRSADRASIVPFATARSAQASESPKTAASRLSAARWIGLAASLLIAAYLTLQWTGKTMPDVDVPSQVATTSHSGDTARDFMPEQTIQEELETYGLIMPVTRDREAERKSLTRLSYDYPPAYGLGINPREPSVPYLGIDGPAPFYAITSEDTVRQL